MANPHQVHLVSSTCSSFCYSDHVSSTQTHLGAGSGYGNPNPPDVYTNLANGIDMIGFDHSSRHDLWKSGVQSYGTNNEDGEYVDDHNDDDDDSLRASCVFPCEGHERPTQGLSLSLSNSSHPFSSLGAQSFELRHHYHHDHHHVGDQSRYMTSSTSTRIPTFNITTPQDEIFVGKSVASSNMNMQFEMMRSSKYLLPSQELLNEFVNLGATTITRKQKAFDDDVNEKNKEKKLKNKVGNRDHNDVLLVANDVDDDDDNDLIEDNVNVTNGCSSRINVMNNNNNNNSLLLSSSSQSSLYGLNLLELQKRKTKLLAMLEELDRRYKLYYEQMKGVVSSFEAIAGPGSANVYSSLASKVMSRHFRSLRDAIVAQIKATKKAIGDKDVANSIHGTTKGETPRLRMLDQAFRQHRALQQMTMVENHPWRPQRGLPERSVSVLRAWLFEHFLHPYPSDVDKHILARQTGLSRSQVSNWFINARVRLWKPMVEQMYQEEAKDHDHQQDDDDDDNNQDQSNFSHDHQHNEPCLTTTHPSLLDQKPTPNQLLMRIEPETLSSIVNTQTTTMATSSKTQHHHHNMHDSQFGRTNEAFGSIESLDFPSSSYGTQAQAQARAHQSHVSLTLGLQQHGGNGVSLTSFSPSQGSVFYGRDHIDDHDQVVHHQYSLMDDDQTAQNLPYRDLMGAQLLHDFAS